uniref:Uncharacterized protein n=1 Tax=Anguilla anguilla TaxID=7936 RepID=A0A0E9RL37_ANGAN
MMTNRFILF